jgi:osmoprotectant transport system substrate-binding protein
MRRSRRPALGAVLLAFAVVTSACRPGGGGTTTNQGEKFAITIGVSGVFTESQIVAEMYAQVLEKAGYEVERQMDLQTREISQPAIEEEEIDLKPEYLLSLLLHYDKAATPSTDPDAVLEKLKPLLDAKKLTLLESAKANDTNALAVTQKTADDRKLSKISDLVPIGAELVMGGPPSCPERPLCLIGLKDKYGLEFKEFKPLDEGGPLTFEALTSGATQVALVFSTDARIVGQKLVVLEDDKAGITGADNIVPLIRSDIVNDEIERLLNAVSATLTTKGMTDLNAKVDIDNEDPEDVAREFLTAEDLL